MNWPITDHKETRMQSVESFSRVVYRNVFQLGYDSDIATLPYTILVLLLHDFRNVLAARKTEKRRGATRKKLHAIPFRHFIFSPLSRKRQSTSTKQNNNTTTKIKTKKEKKRKEKLADPTFKNPPVTKREE